MQSGKVVGLENSLIAHNTIFGWIVAGSINQQPSNHVITCHHTEILDDMLKKFWELEEVPRIKSLSPDEETCERHFRTNVSRNTEGRYIVRLPFKSNSLLGNSKAIARSRMVSMERRFNRQPILKSMYVDFMKEYRELQHMKEINPRISRVSYYLPHHSVTKESSSTTKLRVVFDGSAKPASGPSLNESLLPGPIIQKELFFVILRFRRHKVALCADIEKMYRQILVHSDDQQYQTIVWRENQDEDVKHYQFQTVTYGTTCAPYLAIRTLHQLAADNQIKYPQASDIIRNDFYVDDLLTGSNDILTAVNIQQQLTHVLSSGGFNLRKWMSNSKDVLLQLSNQSNEPKTISICDVINVKTPKLLGLHWDPVSDTFSFKVNISNDVPVTKRAILSDVSKIFDPLGWLTPAIIPIKIIIQKLWLIKLNWDETLPAEVIHQWNEVKIKLASLELIRIPRLMSPLSSTQMLIGFSDASESAYAAVVYYWSRDNSENTKVCLIASKTRVAPLKQITIARLELCAAVLLAKLIHVITKSLNDPSIQTIAFTDSTIVLAWISDHPRRWKTFVANRTAEIIDSVPAKKWKHVVSAENPADCASRGISPELLISNDLWWQGPSWLKHDPSKWPSYSDQLIPEELLEQKTKSITNQHQELENNVIEILFNNISSFTKITLILSFCYRFIHNCKRKNDRNTGCISAKELTKVIRICVKWAQESAFENELLHLKKNQVLTKSSLLSLNPFVDADGIIRLGGRLKNSYLLYDTKHPMILPKNHILTKRLIEHYHMKYLHPTSALLLNLLRQRFWILNGRTQVKQVTHKCVTCYRLKAVMTKQLMGDLPASRVTPGRPFLQVGVDFAGPLTLKLNKSRGARLKLIKSYIALFVCMTTKAIHIELVSDLSTEAFVAALRRFTSRRGVPSDVFSDNGSNFIGAKTELSTLLKQTLNQQLIHSFFQQNEINWHFIPPLSPNFGGLWEAGVKSVKHHLNRVIKDVHLSSEEMNTLLVQIEGLLNSRPISSMQHDDPTNLDVLTPGHFLIGAPLTSIPSPNLEHIKLSRLSRWQLVQ